ncbi:ABC transporter permease [Thalassiella azotivora]
MSSASTTTLAPPAPAVIAPRRPDGLDARPAGLLRLVRIELRKSLDTRSGKALLTVVVLIGLAGLAWRLYHADSSPVSFSHFYGTAMLGTQVVLPIIGVMAMTSEWTQRTALTTFTATPRRGRVLTAKVVSAVLLGLLATVLVTAATALAVLLAGATTGTEPSWADGWELAAGVALVNSLNLLMAAAFGAVLPLTAAAVTAFLVAPTLWAAAAPALLGESARWLDVFDAYSRLMYLNWSDAAATATSLTAWIVVPLVVGVVASLRREVK